MDKKVIFAVAGAGKTSHIIDMLCSHKRSLIVTYTDNNYTNLRNRIMEKFGHIPDHIRIYSYFSFLYSFCLRPFLGDELGIRGINWDTPPDFTQKISRTTVNFFLDRNRRLYSSRMAALPNAKGMSLAVKQRLSKYFDNIFVDEVQDFAGHDFNFMFDLVSADVQVLLVGDFYQHTYDTSRDGNINRSLHANIDSYKRKIEAMGFIIDDISLSKSYRCSPTVCAFVCQKIGINIESHRKDQTILEYVETQDRADELFYRSDIVKLFYQSHAKYPCFSDNWGASKGINSYGSVCVVLNEKTNSLYRQDQLSSLPPTTRNKLYVACTRSSSDLYLVPEKLYKKYKI